MTKKILIIITIIVGLSTVLVEASSPSCSATHSSINNYKSIVRSILSTLSADISSNDSVSSNANLTLENIVLNVRTSISPLMGVAGGVSNVVFDHIIVGGGSDFLTSFLILFKPYPIPRDWMKLSLLKQEISQTLLDMGFGGLLDEPIDAGIYKGRFNSLPIKMKTANDYGDIIDAVWMNQLAMEKIFIRATDNDIDKAKAEIKNFINRIIVRRDKGRELEINYDYFDIIDDIHEHYKDAKTCSKSRDKFMESLKKLKDLASTDYEEITTRFSDSYKRLKDALKLGNYDSDYKERKKQLIRDYMNSTSSSTANNYRESQRNYNMSDLLKDRVAVSGNGFEELRNFGDESISIANKLKGDIGAFLAGNMSNKTDLRNLITIDCDAIIDDYIKKLCEKRKDEGTVGAWKELDKVNKAISMIQTIQAFNNAFMEEFQTAKILLGEGSNTSVNGVTQRFPYISKQIRKSIDLINEKNQIYTNLVDVCNNQCLNIKGKCEPEGEGNN